MNIIMNTFRDKHDERIVFVMWRPNDSRFELYWTNAAQLLAGIGAAHIKTFPVPQSGGMTEWTKHKAQVVTFARGLASMNDAQFDKAISELAA